MTTTSIIQESEQAQKLAAQRPKHGFSTLSVLIIALVAIVWSLVSADRYQLFIATYFLSFVIATAGLNILYGYSGQVSLGHGAFFAVGAYGVGWAMLNTGVPLVLVLPVVLLGVAILAVVLVGPTLRVSGHFLAMVTLAYAIVVDVILINWVDVTGGPLGISVATNRLQSWAPSGESLFILALVIGVGALFAMETLKRSAFGRGLRSMKDSEVAAACLAVPVRRYRITAFVISALLAAIGGAIYGLNVGFLTPAEYNAMLSVNLLLAVIVGGSGKFWGPILGSAVVVVGPEVFRFVGDNRDIVLGAILVFFLAFQAGGIAGMFERLGGVILRKKNSPIAADSAGDDSRLAEEDR